MTDYSRQRDFMFCEMCGTMLSFDTPKYGRCPLCKSNKRLKEIAGKEIRYTFSAEDMRGELGVSALDDIEEERELKQMDYNAKCKACQHLGLAYVARQIRSADEEKGKRSFIPALSAPIDKLRTRKRSQYYH